MLVTPHSQGWKITAQHGTGTGAAGKAGSAGRTLQGSKAELPFDRTQHIPSVALQIT